MKCLEDANKRIMVMGVCGLLVLGNGVARADFAFGSPRNMGPEINSPQDEWAVHTSNDGLTMVFSDSPFSQRGGGRGKIDVYMSTRENMDEPFGPPVNLSTINTSHHDFSPHLSADGLSLYFSSDRPGGYGDMDLWVATRPDRTASFANPRNLGPTINSGQGDFCPFLSPDGLSLYYNSSRWGGHGSCDIYVATRGSVGSSWRTPTNLGSRINTGATDAAPVISEDGLTLYYVSNRSGGFGLDDLYVTTRPSLSSTWEGPVNLGPQFNSLGSDTAFCFVGGGQGILFCSARPGGTGGVDIWEMPIAPIVDFDGDGKVGELELSAVVDQWHTDAALCDVALAPFGDGFVDVQDLLVFAEYVSADVYDPTLLAHWAFDEAEGMVASDNAGGHDGTVVGIPGWQPTGGVVDGALEFDGATFVAADSVLNPNAGPLSVLAWVKGGAPGQAIISQQAGANWLLLDPTTGALMTGLRSGGRTSKALSSQATITNDDWHRVGFTWDGSHRRLYVDDILVAEDTDVALANCNGGLNIGCGKVMAAGTLFTGLIDDIRIYKRAVKP